MGVWIGIDGGGTKTKFLSASKDGKRSTAPLSMRGNVPVFDDTGCLL